MTTPAAEPSDELAPGAQAIWRRIRDDLARSGRWEPRDGLLLEQIATAIHEHARLRTLWAEHGMPDILRSAEDQRGAVHGQLRQLGITHTVAALARQPGLPADDPLVVFFARPRLPPGAAPDRVILDADELRDITGYTRQAEQLRVLLERGFSRAAILNGNLVLERVHFEAVASGTFRRDGELSRARPLRHSQTPEGQRPKLDLDGFPPASKRSKR